MTSRQLLTHHPAASDDDHGDTATIVVDPTERSAEPIDPKLFGKFGEHLYSTRNAKNSFTAQILHNPTFGNWKFQVEHASVDGGRPSVHDAETKAERIEAYADTREYPDSTRLIEAYRSATALWWFPVGDDEINGVAEIDGVDITTSPDVGIAGDRAQRLEVSATELSPCSESADDRSLEHSAGIAQWCHLPTHRTHDFEGSITARAASPTTLTVSLREVGPTGELKRTLDDTTVSVDKSWDSIDFDLRVPDDIETGRDTLFAFSVTTDSPANVVLDAALLYPDDHVDRADPEIVEYLRDAELPVFRWPGGNFVSGYRWRDGVGPTEERPTKPNPAWDGLEPNLFGTVEFLEFCERIGCEPMICVNAGDGSAEEAARWVEYCNGSTETAMGALRAAHGHPESFDVTYWEVGNEVYGPWQVSWTTPDGYADRFARFHEAMVDVDDDIEVLACGNRLTDWNDPVLSTAADRVDWLTDHVLVGTHVGPETDQTELYNAHMALADQVMDEYDDVLEDMRAADVDDPRIALTELQLFTFPDREQWEGIEESPELPTNKSVSEAVYDATFVHESVRSGAVDMLTHSGAGNHGGGLRKHHERVWADPCYYYHRMGSSLFDARPLAVELSCDTYDTETAFATDTEDLFGELPTVSAVPVLDPLAVSSRSGDELVVELVHRDATAGEIDATIELEDGFDPGPEATVTTLAGETMAAENTFEEPETVVPSQNSVSVDGRSTTVSVPPFSIVRVTFSEN
ncbi:alpha-L-arabinofuranosidase C-terminal domain-containing protein [Halostagnicola sp. A-GB9-2]|uniref:alpha-L-arabinofuranosidase C-terminal domain-containing protein n=1 Tax=Halostagnicola sp. A-GB9-2 TaxID=3048066 RepID=UPI0024C07174|nr:alpha-L-arabinofuranosidase C-terminal domain-containing protein [Halostagnicola sp. A-GB9-2]MDJ1433645.1 alpha-L-arabinofuranosidase C-terminal domain-containing protein [Halostagnicola sp. A-GB9-2]